MTAGGKEVSGETQGERMVRVEEGLDGVRESVEQMRGELGKLDRKIENLVGLQHAHDANSQAIAEVRDSVRNFTSRMETWFTEIENDHKNRWSEYYKDRDKWRTDHERDNDSTKQRLIWFSGVGFAVMLLGGVLVSGFVWVLNDRNNRQAEDNARISAEVMRNRDNIEHLKDEQHEIQLYIATQRGASAAAAQTGSQP